MGIPQEKRPTTLDEALRDLKGALHVATETEAATELRLAAAVKLYEMERLSAGAAAELAGLDKFEFLKRVGDCGVPAFRQSPQELDEELKILRSLRD